MVYGKRLKLSIFIMGLLIGLSAKALEAQTRMDFRFGVGTSLLGTGDARTIMLENEMNFKLNRYFVLGAGLAYARNYSGIFDHTSFIQLNTNIYASPFRNTRKNDLRLGTGMTYYRISEDDQSSAIYINGQLFTPGMESRKRSVIGFNLIIENTYSITEKYMLGLKLFTQPYRNGDINSGVLLKFGVKLHNRH